MFCFNLQKPRLILICFSCLRMGKNSNDANNANSAAATAPSAINISSISPPAVQFAIGKYEFNSRAWFQKNARWIKNIMRLFRISANGWPKTAVYIGWFTVGITSCTIFMANQSNTTITANIFINSNATAR